MTAMRDRRAAPAARLVLAVSVATAITLGGVLAGCGGSDARLQGIVRSAPLVVGDASVTEVTNDMAPTPFSFRAEPDELLVVYFGYTNCPDLCPTTLAALRSAMKQIGDDAERVDLAMVTVDPDRDAPVLSQYLGSFVTRYHALVPQSDAELTAAQDAFLVTSSVQQRPGGDVIVEHSANAFVVDDAGNVVVEWPFGHSTAGMVNDLTVLFDEM
jgi:protein SCO1